MDFQTLTPKQRKLLKKIAKESEIRTDKYKLDDLNYLYELGYIKAFSCDKPDDFFYQAFISEKGKAFLHGYKIHVIGEHITRALAILALVLSLINTFTPFPDVVQELIKSWLSNQ